MIYIKNTVIKPKIKALLKKEIIYTDNSPKQIKQYTLLYNVGSNNIKLDFVLELTHNI